jgi:hypothetical protein
LAAAQVRWFGLIGRPIGRAILVIAGHETSYIHTGNYAMAIWTWQAACSISGFARSQGEEIPLTHLAA